MEYRRFGNSGFVVPVFSFGTATFGGTTEFFKAWGSTNTKEAQKIVDICLDVGLNFFDTANGYSDGQSEAILGDVVAHKRKDVLISTKVGYPSGTAPMDFGTSRFHLINSLDASLKRLKTDYIDLYHLHAFDPHTPIEETLSTLDSFVKSGKVRYIACSNFSGWHLMKSLSIADKYGFSKYVGHQIYYSLVGREAEWELIPLGLDQGVGTMVWSPLAGGALSGKIRRNTPLPANTRVAQMRFVDYEDDVLFRVVDVLDDISRERQKTPSQVALNWLLRRPTVSNVIIGARNETQLKENLGALGWALTPDEVVRLDKASATRLLYPKWQQARFPLLDIDLNKYAQ